jgi:two-component system sensor histidine kinase/response regulator
MPGNGFTGNRGRTVVKTEKPSILIVDDRRENLLATEKVLKNLSATLFKASSGNEALSLMLRHKFAVILLDVQMPEMDGFETASLMQEDETMRDTPIIFVTAISKEDKYATRAAEIGAVDYIFKPINPDILRSKVQVYLDLYVQKEQILSLNDGLRQSNEELERFAYICSHDLKSPLRAIDNISQWLEEDLAEALQGKSLDLMQEMRKRVRRMEKLLDDTLAYSRAGTRQDDSRNETISGQVLMDDVVALLMPPSGFTINIDPRLAVIRLHPLPIRQVLYNLVNNAIKHHESESGVIDVGCHETKDFYSFTVRDDGPGIPAEFHQKIFDMFQTLKPRDQREGSGMGLALVKKILATHGGEIAVESAPGEGALFRFTWPKSEEAPHARKAAS